MNRQRYEPVPQREREEPIILSSIHNSPSYNYNSAIPNSIASSTRTPSIIAPSIPSSPPPSFHTHSSPGTPRPTPGTTVESSGQSYAELWGVAPSTVGGETEITMGTSNDALATIAGLKQRVESLEETIGRLLLERDNTTNAIAKGIFGKRDNCCVTFTDASPDLERVLTQESGSNCCVTFRTSDSKKAHNHLIVKIVVIGALFITIVLTILIVKLADANAARVHADQRPEHHFEQGR